ncbi:PREDICTED: CASP-like protein 4A4 [Tarenaya hassleriana]|uniref:CASP-like protein 4A4 n=1 Tax=Tarenaya hassleriana TaxID=28532 RepID=UPI00053C284D|nr:PREDICTED: CASP-like protein 4A4 [Tarenaya hassleriana]
MKEHSDHVVVIACASPVADGGTTAAIQSPFPSPATVPAMTPSPFAVSVASTRFSSRRRPSDHVSGVVLRFMALVFSFVSALSLAIQTPSSRPRHRNQSSGFAAHPELVYCFGVALTAFLYSALQTFKGVCDVSHRGVLISDSLSDYASFILDQIMCYLLVSSSSVAIAKIQDMDGEDMKTLRKGSIVSASMSFLAFFVLAISCLFSGYKLCKRFIW